MRKVVRLTERDLARLVKRVVNEGMDVMGDINNFPDGVYQLTKVGAVGQGAAFFEKKGSTTQIIDHTQQGQNSYYPLT
jgi:hypothetical protein